MFKIKNDITALQEGWNWSANTVLIIQYSEKGLRPWLAVFCFKGYIIGKTQQYRTADQITIIFLRKQSFQNSYRIQNIWKHNAFGINWFYLYSIIICIIIYIYIFLLLCYSIVLILVLLYIDYYLLFVI